MAPSRLPLHLMLLVASVVSALPTNSVFTRQSDDTCPASQTACSTSLPSGFCCPDDNTCVALAGNTTALCCPKGSSCDRISPITCNIQQQNPEKNSKAPIKTSVFDVELESCGAGTCCPFGYSCENGDECVMDEDQSLKPGEKKASITSSATSEAPTSTQTTAPDAETETTSVPTETATERETDTETTASSTATSSPTGEAEESGSGEVKSSGPDTTTIIGGVVGGIAALLTIAIIIFICARRRANKKNKTPSEKSSQHRGHGHSTSTSGNVISQPIVQEDAWRTDFMRGNNPARASIASTTFSESADPFNHINNINGLRIQNPPALTSEDIIRNSTHASIHNPFNSSHSSPRPSSRTSSVHSNYPNTPHQQPPTGLASPGYSIKNGRIVGGYLAPIRAMKAPRTPRAQRAPSCESINVFADPGTVERKTNDRQSGGSNERWLTAPSSNRFSMGTTISGFMSSMKKDFEREESRKNYPGATPRI